MPGVARFTGYWMETDHMAVTRPAHGPQEFKLRTTRPRPDTVVIGVSGGLDAVSAPELGELLDCRLRSMLDRVVVDLTELEFLSSAGLSVLVHANLLAGTHDTVLRIRTGRNRQVNRTLSLTGLDQLLPIVTSVSPNWPPRKPVPARHS
ncbi:STAS domain-containing protein [Amycolatopsis sp. H20-H5]|uniref:STAS domain-containing protein n=1 Tax=Amycolatopsis sp. H20-H5 TaxID=3046309 RepID=UPI002DB6D30C|nr:STAS domain-containing protein [Amycolatopsis sp. H20-H5]MEC3981649.1 STAS domain-containing protein [Amycolatopsis sp. H20-H5]